jgi:hypothetical protein
VVVAVEAGVISKRRLHLSAGRRQIRAPVQASADAPAKGIRTAPTDMKVLPYEPVWRSDYDFRSPTQIASARRDIFALLSRAPADVPYLLQQLRLGRIGGQDYYQPVFDCGCLVGTLARGHAIRSQEEGLFKQRPIRYTADQVGLRIDPNSPAEAWVFEIQLGDAPDNCARVAITESWIQCFLEVYKP